MTQEIDNKRQRLLDMTEHPERYSEKEIEETMHDPELQDFLEMLALTKRAADPHRNDTADVEQEWQRFAAAHPQTTAHRFRRVAAAVTTGILVTGLAVAAIVKTSVSSKKQETVKTETLSKPVAVDTTKKATTTLPVDSISAKPKVYDNVPLQTLLNDMASYYHKKLVNQSGDKQNVRLYFEWDQRKSLEENIGLLNNFNRFDITVEGDNIILK
jgi:hypothetical protein